MVISLSGGADSSTLLAYALANSEKPIQPVSFHYEQRHKREITAASLFCQHYRIKVGPERLRPLLHVRLDLPTSSALTNPSIPVPTLDEVLGHPQPPTYVPFRNLIFAAHCLAVAESQKLTQVALGVHRSDTYGYWDTTPEFILSLESIAALNRGPRITLWAPFLNYTKERIISWGLLHGVPYQLTWSCYEGGEKPCLKCATCVERRVAFENCNARDPLLEV
jgi:7-cyano-7-deazaguanine synthase